ncbi:MAG: hydrogenase maturation protease [Methylococcaceae bacterium]|jgi:hydrogenase maturation protease
MLKPLLLLAFGNLSRGDDALAPLLLDFVGQTLNLTHIELLCDFQLQIEHALDLEHRQRVLFVDASVSCTNAFEFSVVKPAQDASYTTHAMTPAAVLAVYQQIKKQNPPPCFLLSIKGEQFELGADLTPTAQQNLGLACAFIKPLLINSNLESWLQLSQPKQTLNIGF